MKIKGESGDDAGLQAGDVIIEFGGKEIKFSSDLPHVVGRIKPKTKEYKQREQSSREERSHRQDKGLFQEIPTLPWQTFPHPRYCNFSEP